MSSYAIVTFPKAEEEDQEDLLLQVKELVADEFLAGGFDGNKPKIEIEYTHAEENDDE